MPNENHRVASLCLHTGAVSSAGVSHSASHAHQTERGGNAAIPFGAIKANLVEVSWTLPLARSGTAHGEWPKWNGLSGFVDLLYSHPHSTMICWNTTQGYRLLECYQPTRMVLPPCCVYPHMNLPCAGNLLLTCERSSGARPSTCAAEESIHHDGS